MKRWMTIGVLVIFAGVVSAGNLPAGPMGPRCAAQLSKHVDLDGDGLTESVQLAVGGRRMRLAGWGLGSFEFALAAQAFDFVVVDWVPGGALELVVATRRGIFVHAVDGRILEARVAPLEDAFLVEHTTPSGGAAVVAVTRHEKCRDAVVHLLRPARSSARIGAVPKGHSAVLEDEVGTPKFAIRYSAKRGMGRVLPSLVVGTATVLRLPLEWEAGGVSQSRRFPRFFSPSR